jgi:hypothetical protein
MLRPSRGNESETVQLNTSYPRTSAITHSNKESPAPINYTKYVISKATSHSIFRSRFEPNQKIKKVAKRKNLQSYSQNGGKKQWCTYTSISAARQLYTGCTFYRVPKQSKYHVKIYRTWRDNHWELKKCSLFPPAVQTLPQCTEQSRSAVTFPADADNADAFRDTIKCTPISIRFRYSLLCS